MLEMHLVIAGKLFYGIADGAPRANDLTTYDRKFYIRKLVHNWHLNTS